MYSTKSKKIASVATKNDENPLTFNPPTSNVNKPDISKDNSVKFVEPQVNVGGTVVEAAQAVDGVSATGIDGKNRRRRKRGAGGLGTVMTGGGVGGLSTSGNVGRTVLGG